MRRAPASSRARSPGGKRPPCGVDGGLRALRGRERERSTGVLITGWGTRGSGIGGCFLVKLRFEECGEGKGSGGWMDWSGDILHRFPTFSQMTQERGVLCSGGVWGAACKGSKSIMSVFFSFFYVLFLHSASS